MEFPAIGAHCASTSCQSLSFLPFQCPFCSFTYCSIHRLPASHSCKVWEAESASNSVHLCPRCDQLLLAPKGSDPSVILQEHLDRACSLHLLPTVHSIAVLCALPACGRRDRVVQKCDQPPGGCAQVYCLKHRHPSDHACTKLKEREQAIKDSEKDMQQKKEAIASKFCGVSASTPTTPAANLSPDERAAAAKAKADQARAAIAEAKAKVAARTTAKGSTTSSLGSGSASSATTPAGLPKIKKASRVVSLIKLRKVAQGEDKIPASSRLHVYIRSPTFPVLDDKAVFVDKTWTVGRTMDKIVEWLKITIPKNEPFDSQKRFSIFHAKEPEDPPELLIMQERLQVISKVESGDIFYLAPADHQWSRE
ncbi:zinc finger, AN1-type domain [Podila verticillata]|nr:zinc finger, AN1-type domain [Podila verticillata]KFH66331.1 hypothetical protein MVEG_08430 [Podila verticillata NRRL 6337]